MAHASAIDRLGINGAMATDVGCVRSSNEDSVAYVTPTDTGEGADRGALAIVADGMGGHAAGEVASALATEIVRRVYFALDSDTPSALETAFETANKAILDHAKANPECKGMGTTCTALVLRDNRAFLAHVGDSRAYLLRDGVLTQLSEDQSLHAKLIREGLMTEEEAASQPGANYILQALGTSLSLEPAVWGEGLPLAANDVLVLCSDGLSNLVPDSGIAKAAGLADPQHACRLLIEAARAGGGYDNISVGIFRMEEAGAIDEDAAASTRRITAFREEAEDMGSTRVIRVPAA